MLSLDLPISFLYMSKHCSISVIYSWSNKFIFCAIHYSVQSIFHSPSYMNLSSFNQAKQKPSISKSQLWLFDTFSIKTKQKPSISKPQLWLFDTFSLKNVAK